MLIGHKAIFDKLKKECDSGKLHHAQLFVGPKGVGKTHTAILMASYMQGGEQDVLLKKQIFEGLNQDTSLLLDNGEGLSIEEVRSVRERAGQSHFGKYLIVVIENIGRMKPEAMNALLKILEEPNPNTVFFLTANSEEDILPTIRSRCMVNRFQTVHDSLMREACNNHVQTENLLFFAMGRPGKLMRLMADNEYLEAHQSILADVSAFLSAINTPKAFEIARKYESSPFLPEFFDVLLRQVRGLIFKDKKNPAMQNLDIPAILEQIEDANQDINANTNTRLTLETLLLSFVP